MLNNEVERANSATDQNSELTLKKASVLPPFK